VTPGARHNRAMRTRLPLLLALLATLAAAVLTACGSSSDSSKTNASSGSDDPQALLKKAFGTRVDSGVLDLKARADVQGSGQASGPFSLALNGPFQSRGVHKSPLLDWKVKVSGAGQSQDVGLIVTADNAYVGLRGQEYEVGRQLFSRYVRRARAGSARGGKTTLADLGVHPADWIENPKVSSGQDVGGDSTRRVTGAVKVRTMVADLARALRSPQLRAQLRRQGQSPSRIPSLSRSDLDKVDKAIKRATFAVDVDDKNRARRVALTAAFTAPSGGSVKGGTFRLAYSLPEVDTKPRITAPENAQPLALLLQQLGAGSALPGGGGLKTQ
jgi:hypothetical protein